MWIVESKPDASHRIRVDANIKYAVSADRDSCGRFVENVNTRESPFFSSTLIKSFRISLQKKLPTFDGLNEMEKAR